MKASDRLPPRSSAVGQSRLKKVAFELHQATERSYHCVFLVRTLYSPKTHSLNRLRKLAQELEPRLVEVWPNEAKSERRAYDLAEARTSA
ncbi:MAG: hypothetical protein ACJ8ER_15825 [Allosphingosinicella sp.]